MLELYQFELSQYSEKVRFILDYKGLEYRKIEVTPGVGQIEVMRMSGQRQVPVLKDGNTVVADSTAIAFYLEEKYPEKPIIPVDPVHKGQCLLIEEWADESIGIKGRKALIGAINQNQNFRTAILPQQVPDVVKNLVGAVPGELLSVLGVGVGLGPDAIKQARTGLHQDLEALSLILEQRPYLVTDYPTLADITVAAMTMILKFPEGNYVDLPNNLKGKGIPEFTDSSKYEAFWSWRSRLYTEFRRPLNANTITGDSAPTTIEIE